MREKVLLRRRQRGEITSPSALTDCVAHFFNMIRIGEPGGLGGVISAESVRFLPGTFKAGDLGDRWQNGRTDGDGNIDDIGVFINGRRSKNVSWIKQSGLESFSYRRGRRVSSRSRILTGEENFAVVRTTGEFDVSACANACQAKTLSKRELGNCHWRKSVTHVASFLDGAAADFGPKGGGGLSHTDTLFGGTLCK